MRAFQVFPDTAVSLGDGSWLETPEITSMFVTIRDICDMKWLKCILESPSVIQPWANYAGDVMSPWR